MSVRKALVIATVSLRRLLRDRVSLFFVVVLPVLITLVIGLSAFGAGGGSALSLGLVDEDGAPLARDLVEQLARDDALAVRRYDDADGLRRAVRRGHVLGGVVVPRGYDAGLRSGAGSTLVFVLSPAGTAPAGLRAAVSADVAEQSARVQAARFASENGGGDFAAAYARAGAPRVQAPAVTVAAETVAAPRAFPRGFSYPAAANLILFMFITSLIGASDLVALRQLGVWQRMRSTPTTSATILAGQGLGRLGVALFQGLFVFAIGAIAFGVNFGDPVGAAALIFAFGIVAAAVSMLLGTLFRTPDQAASIAPPLGIALGMLGGCMWPLEIVPQAMRAVGHLTPHAWAMDAFIALMGRGAGVADIASQLLALLAFAAILVPFAILRVRRSLVR